MLELRGSRALLIGLSLLGCGGGDDDASTISGLAGMYETTEDALSMPCAADAMPVTPPDPSYLRIADETTFGSSYVAVYPCPGPDASSCDKDAFPLVDFASAAGNGTFKSEETSLSSSGGPMPTECEGHHTMAQITKTSSGVTITVTDQSGTMTGADLCKFDQGEFTSQQRAAIKALPCTTLETRQAKRL